MATKIKAFLVHSDATPGTGGIDSKITKVVDEWLDEHGDEVVGAPVVSTDPGFTKALVLITYEPKEAEKPAAKK